MNGIGLEILKIALSAIGGGGLTFIAILLKRKWEKEDKKDEIMQELDKLNGKIDTLQSSFMEELQKDREENAEYRARQSRVRILQFNDELMRNERHTKESFDDVISEIDQYEDFCSSHPTFPNFKAIAAIANIKEIYKKLVREGGFLTYKQA